MAWMWPHRWRVAGLLGAAIALLLLCGLPYNETRERTDACMLCGSYRAITQPSSYYIHLPESQRITFHMQAPVTVVFPSHRHIWVHVDTRLYRSSLLGVLDGHWMGSGRYPHYLLWAELCFLRSDPTDGLRPVERGQGWIDIMLGSETPAARAILAAQPPGDVERLRKELSDPRWQQIIGGYKQLPVPAKEPAAVYWGSLPVPATTQGSVK